jgi:hypothetical protein
MIGRPRHDDDNAGLEAQLRGLGATDEQIAERLAQREASEADARARMRFKVFPANWRAVTIFLERGFRCMERSQMNGKPIGLRVEALEALLRLEGEGDNLELFDQVMRIGDGVVMGVGRA